MEKNILEEIYEFSQIQPKTMEDALWYLSTSQKVSEYVHKMIESVGWFENSGMNEEVQYWQQKIRLEIEKYEEKAK